MAKQNKIDDEAKPAPAPAPAPPAGPTTVLVVGHAAHDPLAHVDSVPGAPVISLATWLAAKGVRDVDSAGFASWARANAPAEQSSDAWAALRMKFNQTPIK